MKFCSECQQCYDDSIAACELKSHGLLSPSRPGSRRQIEGYEINSRIESDSPYEIFSATHLASENKVKIKFIRTGENDTGLRVDLQNYLKIDHSGCLHVLEFERLGEDEFFVVFEFQIVLF